MIVRMAHWNCKPECHGEAVERFQNGALPILRRQTGFLRAQLLEDPDRIGRTAYTCWESVKNYRAFTDSKGLREITEMFAHMYLDAIPPKALEYHVLCDGEAS